ncbi:low temperature requirement protein A [Cellulomonas aerilata]|uniref:Membrane protein n=1 Tax=Cellulomonas aerilata TaxID=515326 RepID=A0A512D7C9_9CELL|nr:low temperature requirement protein A [Cellulomonas aerilata]GEO32381.1 membrane protein [Cellulomonas aerilata]
MSVDTLVGRGRVRLAVPLVGRDPDEPHRAATPLELFFDLVFVVAVALAAASLHHGIADGHAPETVLGFTLVFFAVYWAWVNFTWFASSFDTDDLVFRLATFVTMGGALVFAAGVPRAVEGLDFDVAVIGYAIMRIAQIAEWLRVAASGGPRAPAGRRFVIGLLVLQTAWLTITAVAPERALVPLWILLALGEMGVPIWAERAARTSWHTGHIAERYGLFMIIVLGESVLAGSLAIQTVLDEGAFTAPLLQIVGGGLLVLFAMWWVYFERPEDWMLRRLPTAFVWSYLHLVVFAAVAAVGAGLAVALEHATGHGEIGATGAALSVAVPLAAYLLSLWSMYVRSDDAPIRRVGIPVLALLVLAAVLTPWPVLAMGVLLVVYIALKLRLGATSGAGAPVAAAGVGAATGAGATGSDQSATVSP